MQSAVVKYAIAIAYFLFVAVVSVCRPEALASNDFVNKFVGADLISVLAVVMTITFASIANIHLTISRIIGAAFKDDFAAGQMQASALRSQLNSNAWLMFIAFIGALICAAIKGIHAANSTVIAVSDGLGVGALVIHILVFHDIYAVLFDLSASDVAVKGEISKTKGDLS